MGKFGAAVAAWSKEKELAVQQAFVGATLELVEEIRRPLGQGGNMPVDTGYLRESLDASYSSTPSTAPSDGPPKVGLSLKVEALIRRVNLGQKIYFGFTATYAARQNYGFQGMDSWGRVYNMAGHHFVELGIQRWPEIVKKHQGTT